MLGCSFLLSLQQQSTPQWVRLWRHCQSWSQVGWRWRCWETFWFSLHFLSYLWFVCEGFSLCVALLLPSFDSLSFFILQLHVSGLVRSSSLGFVLCKNKNKKMHSLTCLSTFKALLLNATLRKKHLCVYKVKQEKITGINRSGVTFFNDVNESDIQKTSLKPKCHISQYRPAKFKHVATHMLLPEAARAELWWYQRKKKHFTKMNHQKHNYEGKVLESHWGY